MIVIGLALAIAPAQWCLYRALVAYAEHCRLVAEAMLDNDPVLWFREVI